MQVDRERELDKRRRLAVRMATLRTLVAHCDMYVIPTDTEAIPQCFVEPK